VPPQPLGFRDQFAFWANLGVSLLGFGGALLILQPVGFDPLPLVAALLAALVGTVVGALMVAWPRCRVRDRRTSMALLRGLFGTKISIADRAQHAAADREGTFELFIIAERRRLSPTGSATLGVHRRGRNRHHHHDHLATRFDPAAPSLCAVAVFVAMAYFTVVFLRDGRRTSQGALEQLPSAVDIALAVAISGCRSPRTTPASPGRPHERSGVS
jgi:hypothetical protein